MSSRCTGAALGSARGSCSKKAVRQQRGSGIALLCLVLACAGETHQQSVLLADSAVVASGVWSHFSAPEPLRTVAYHHEVCFTPLAPIRLSEQPMGLVDERDAPISVQVNVSGADGLLDLPLVGYMDQRICFGIHDPEVDRRFNEVRLFASSTIRVKDLEWLSTDK